VGHPLDPLSADEIRAAVAILRRDRALTDRWRFATIELREPRKGDAAPAREASLLLWNRDDGNAYKAVVSLTDDRVATWEHRPGEQPNMTIDEFREVNATLRDDPRLVAALAQRGVTDIDTVLLDVWAYGASLVPSQYGGRRVGWCDVWVRDEHGSNPYANPIAGLHPIVDLNAMELLELEDTGVVERAPTMGEYVPRLVPDLRLRDDLKPLELRQPEGFSFALDGNELRWQRWSLRIGFNPREGMVLHTVGYEDDGRVRPVAHRLSFAEMVVPYRDPTGEHERRTAFDIGEWGLGFMTTSLALGCDCLGDIAYLDATVHDSHGEPQAIPNAICIHEDDSAVLWKHVDEQAGAEVRRMRRLTISFHATVANYEYLVYWHLHEDASIECEVRATGIMVTTSTSARTRRSTSTSSSRGSTSTSTARRTPSTPRTPSRCRPARTTRTASRWSSARRHCVPRPRASRTTTGTRSARGRSSARPRATGSARRRATSSSPAARCPRCSTRPRRCSSARR
jgi:primary-amine oxidase